MMVMISVLEPALTVSPTLMPTETTVPLIGLVSVASFSDCCALVSWASAVSMAAWSLAICSGESELADPAPPLAPARSVALPVAAGAGVARDVGGQGGVGRRSRERVA